MTAAPRRRNGSFYRRLGKRLLDILLSALALLALLPLMGLVAFLVRINLGSPILFRQLRPGKDGKPFVLVKFRTMADRSGDSGVADEERLSRFGRFLRSTSLDELPELINVIRGEMSLVGPRPLLMEYLPLYSEFQGRRHEALPGLTGWAQINGRNAVTWQQRFELDVWYVDHQSFSLDLKILTRTFLTVLAREGIEQPGHATAERFTGNELQR
jgi:sugar transferase EpsL